MWVTLTSAVQDSPELLLSARRCKEIKAESPLLLCMVSGSAVKGWRGKRGAKPVSPGRKLLPEFPSELRSNSTLQGPAVPFVRCFTQQRERRFQAVTAHYNIWIYSYLQPKRPWSFTFWKLFEFCSVDWETDRQKDDRHFLTGFGDPNFLLLRTTKFANGHFSKTIIIH